QVEKISDGAFDEAAYQLALQNCGVTPDTAGRYSSKRLTQIGFERLMSLFEDLGFRDASGDDQHWRRRTAARTGYATSRQVYEILKHDTRTKYQPVALSRRASNDQHNTPEKHTIPQAAKLIEALKAIAARPTKEADHGQTANA